MNRLRSCPFLSRIVFVVTLPLSHFPSFAAPPLPSLELRVAFPELKFDRPLWMEEIPDGSKRLAVMQQDGKVLLLSANRKPNETKTFLDISDRKPWVQNEEGLLALAFHPQFKTNGLFYIYYSQHSPLRGVLSEVRVSGNDPNQADLSTERILIELPKPNGHHNGTPLLLVQDG